MSNHSKGEIMVEILMDEVDINWVEVVSAREIVKGDLFRPHPFNKDYSPW